MKRGREKEGGKVERDVDREDKLRERERERERERDRDLKMGSLCNTISLGNRLYSLTFGYSTSILR